MNKIQVIDTHTGGEPTRIVVAGGPDLGDGSLAERRERFRDQFDEFRSAVVNEPRGSEVMVGALLCEAAEPGAAAGVIFFNNVGVLNMCGHGTIGVAVALAHLQRIGAGRHKLDTPVGDVTFELAADLRQVSFENVRSYRHQQGVRIDVREYGQVTGDVAWGGNWFYLVENHGQELAFARAGELTRFALAVRQALEQAGIAGEDGAVIDHIELFSPTETATANSRNFVLCPGGAWDRSPCGTGTSAKLACLAAEGKLLEGETWRQESIVGSVFTGTYRTHEAGGIIPHVSGSAWVTAEATLLLDRNDPLCMGIRG